MTAGQAHELTSTIAELIARSSKGGKIHDCGFGVTFNTKDGTFNCASVHEGDDTILLMADAIIDTFYGYDDPDEREAWAAANPDEAAHQYVNSFFWELDVELILRGNQ